MRVVAVGECTIDRYLDAGVEHVGGISLNFAINASRVGAEQVGLVSCTGNDAAAEAVRRRLAAVAIDTTHLHSMPGRTASQKIRIAAEGERVFPPDGYDAGVLVSFELRQADFDYLRGADVIAVPLFRQIAHLFTPILRQRDLGTMRVVDLLDGADLGAMQDFDSIEDFSASQGSGALPRLAADAGVNAVPSLDAASGACDDGQGDEDGHHNPDHRPLHHLERIGPLLDPFDVLFISGDEETVECLLPWSRRTRSVLVVTHGAKGSSALVNGVRHVAPAEFVPVRERIDTTGCGDAFQAAFTVDYFRNRDVQSALREGARRAAVVIRHLGATSDEM